MNTSKLHQAKAFAASAAKANGLSADGVAYWDTQYSDMPLCFRIGTQGAVVYVDEPGAIVATHDRPGRFKPAHTEELGT